MKRVIAFMFLFSLIFGTTIAQSSKETRNLKGFTKVNFGIAGNLQIKIGPEFSVVLDGTESDLNEVITELSGDNLIIKQDHWRFNFKESINVYITMPEIESLGVSGSGKAEILDPVKEADNLRLSVSGSGRLLTKDLAADSFDCDISGSGSIYIDGPGMADNGEIVISGSGNYSGESFKIDHLDVNISGSGSCVCKAGDSLNASISGSGNVTYSGDPKIDARVSGSGHVRAAR